VESCKIKPRRRLVVPTRKTHLEETMATEVVRKDLERLRGTTY
jgi:hypothetical protein